MELADQTARPGDAMEAAVACRGSRLGLPGPAPEQRVVYLVGPAVSLPSIPDSDHLLELAGEILGSSSGRLDEHLARQPEDRRHRAALF